MSKIITLQALFKYCHGSSSPILGGDLKISDHNNWGGGPKQKIKFERGAKFNGGPKSLWGAMNPNDVMVVVLKDILLC